MRELTKTVLRFSWGMSLFGVQQALNAFKTQNPDESLDAVTDEVKDQLGDNLGWFFRAGDQVQGHIVDSMYDAGKSAGRDPGNIMGLPWEMMRRATEVVRGSMQRHS